MSAIKSPENKNATKFPLNIRNWFKNLRWRRNSSKVAIPTDNGYPDSYEEYFLEYG